MTRTAPHTFSASRSRLPSRYRSSHCTLRPVTVTVAAAPGSGGVTVRDSDRASDRRIMMMMMPVARVTHWHRRAGQGSGPGRAQPPPPRAAVGDSAHTVTMTGTQAVTLPEPAVTPSQHTHCLTQ